MDKGSSVVMENGLQVSCDWIEFTMKEGFDETSPSPYIHALDLMGYHSNEFSLPSLGGNGYRKKVVRQLNTGEIKVYFDGANIGMGMHISISGQCLNDVLEHFQNSNSSETPFSGPAYEITDFDETLLTDFLRAVSASGRITRFDLAIDDVGAHYFTVADFKQILEKGQYSSRIRFRKFIVSHDRDKVTGETVYFGRRESEFMLRVYDKQLEQNKKRTSVDLPEIENPWVRWEMELKGNSAGIACDELISGKSLATVASGILNQKIRLINLDNNRKCRCTTLQLWNDFIGNVEKIRLYIKPLPSTINDRISWLYRQVAPSLASVVEALDGTTEFIYNLLESGKIRLSSKDWDMIHAYWNRPPEIVRTYDPGWGAAN